MLSKTVCSLLPLFAAVGLFAAQSTADQSTKKPNQAKEAKAAKAPPVTALSKAKHFAIAYLAAAPGGDPADVSKSQTSILQNIGDGLAKKLSTKDLVRVPALDVQCCTIQLTLLSKVHQAGPGMNLPLSVRIVVMDIDTQQVYTRELKSTAKEMKSAVDELIASLIADDKLLHALNAS